MNPGIRALHLTLIGMSNIGKSHWARRLAAESGFEHIDCDLLIEKKLAPELAQRGHKGLHGVAQWLGHPYDPQYPETSRKYVGLERAVMQEVIKKLQTAKKPMVVDTTGSVIYAGDDIADQLRALTRVVYLEALPENISQLFENYAKEPKPVIWDGIFTPLPGETPRDALIRCYPELLRSRDRRYRQIAHAVIPFGRHKNPQTDLRALAGAGQ